MLLNKFLALFCTFQTFCTKSRRVFCCHRLYTWCHKGRISVRGGCPYRGSFSRPVFQGAVCRDHPLSLIETLVFGELSESLVDVS